MWIIRGISDKNASFILRLRPQQTYSIGRKQHAINLGACPEDGISRNHGHLTLSQFDNENASTATLYDTSTHGIFVCLGNNKEFVKVKSCILATGTKLKFGKSNQLFQIAYEPLYLSVSLSNTNDLKETESICLKNELYYSKELNQNTQCLLMLQSDKMMTLKQVLALAKGLWIITLEWLKTFDSLEDVQFVCPKFNE
jgi:hypothetical protein